MHDFVLLRQKTFHKIRLRQVGRKTPALVLYIYLTGGEVDLFFPYLARTWRHARERFACHNCMWWPQLPWTCMSLLWSIWGSKRWLLGLWGVTRNTYSNDELQLYRRCSATDVKTNVIHLTIGMCPSDTYIASCKACIWVVIYVNIHLGHT